MNLFDSARDSGQLAGDQRSWYAAGDGHAL
jgi:hypothetical protein